jgi:replicative DNA helicase
MEASIMEAYLEYGSKPLIVTIDHSWLIKKRIEEKEKIATIYNTTEMLMKLKNRIPVIIIMITQLNRNIDEANRRIPSSVANYPTSSDIFGGDALMQGSDMVIVINRPSKSDIKSYGPYAYDCKDEDVFMHLLKVRNGKDDDNLMFLRMDGERQRLVEVPEPLAHRPEGTFIRRSERAGTPSRFVSAEIGKEL